MRLFKASASSRHRLRLLSVSGMGNGACYADVPYAVSVLIPDVDFRLASYYRLDLPLYPLEAHCKHHKFDTEGKHSWCGKLLKHDPDHPLKCKLGGAVSRIHTAIAQLLALFCREVGWNTRLEVVVPEFVKPKRPDSATVAEKKQCKEQMAAPVHLGVHEHRTWEHAIMDIVASHPLLQEELLIDVMVRHPTSVKLHKAGSEPGAAALAGENDKRTRYPPTRGKRVVPGPRIPESVANIAHAWQTTRCCSWLCQRKLFAEMATDVEFHNRKNHCEGHV